MRTRITIASMAKDPNEGARLLRLAMEVERLTHDAVERLIGGGSVSRYLSGQRLPDRLTAIALHNAFEIPVESWDERPAPKGSVSQSTKPSNAVGVKTNSKELVSP